MPKNFDRRRKHEVKSPNTCSFFIIFISGFRLTLAWDPLSLSTKSLTGLGGTILIALVETRMLIIKN